jgi:hypothetical protein
MKDSRKEHSPKSSVARRAWSVRHLVIFLGLGIGVILVAALLSCRRPGGGPSPRSQGPSLLVEQKNDPVLTESGIEGHHDARFQNPTDKPVTVRLEWMDCDCTHLLLAVAPDAWNGLDVREFHQRAADPALTWQPHEQGGKGLTVPPQGAGLVRLTWQTKQLGDHVFQADLSVEDDSGKGRQRLEVPVRMVPPVYLRSAEDPTQTEVDVGRLNAGETRTAAFVAYSETRDQFLLLAAPPAVDPCVSYGARRPLTRDELQTLSSRVGRAVRAGYRLPVTVREQAEKTRLDLGPFRRNVVWTTDVYSGHEVSSQVNGTVQGNVWLAAPEGKDLVDLGAVSPTDPVPVTFALESRDRHLQVRVDEEATLSFLRVELLDGHEGKATGSGKTWRVRVCFRTDSLFRGDFPNPGRRDYNAAVLCCVVFQVSDAAPGAVADSLTARRLLVPVRGTVKSF